VEQDINVETIEHTTETLQKYVNDNLLFAKLLIQLRQHPRHKTGIERLGSG
jgi:hypothetical protein